MHVKTKMSKTSLMDWLLLTLSLRWILRLENPLEMLLSSFQTEQITKEPLNETESTWEGVILASIVVTSFVIVF